MIKEIRLKNFLSYQDESIILNDFNVIVGANASGKSNFIKALITLRNLVIGGFQSSEDFDPFLETIFRKTASENDSLGISVVIENPVELKLTNGGNVVFLSHHYSIELKFGLGVIKENYHVTVRGAFKHMKLLERNEKQVRYATEYNIDFDKSLNITLDDNTFERIRFQPLIGKTLSAFLMSFIQAYCNGFLTYNINPNLVLLPSIGRNQKVLNTDGNNLAGVLQYYKQHKPEVIDSINEILRRNIPTIDYVHTNHLGISNNFYFLVREKDGKDYLLNELSEGTDCFIGLVTAMVTSLYLELPPNSKNILIIEDPERGLHPQLMEEVVAIAKSLTDKFQIIITTHSTDLIAQLELEDLVLLDKTLGGTRIKRVNKTEHLTAYLKEFSLDQIWLNNDLEGGTVHG